MDKEHLEKLLKIDIHFAEGYKDILKKECSRNKPDKKLIRIYLNKISRYEKQAEKHMTKLEKL